MVPLAVIPSPDSGEIQIGPVAVHVYGLMYAIGVFAAVHAHRAAAGNAAAATASSSTTSRYGPFPPA